MQSGNPLSLTVFRPAQRFAPKAKNPGNNEHAGIGQ
jgi:hypothetical protein